MKSTPAISTLNTDASSAPHDHAPTPAPIWDRLGIIGSVACIIHCALTPALAGTLAAFGFLGDAIIHQVMVVLLLAVALLAFWPGFRIHRDLRIVAGAVAGVSLLIATGFMHDVLHHLVHGQAAEIGLTMLGSVILVGTHVANQRLVRAEGCSQADGSCCSE
ncbi:MerC domain-containing protein [Lujinxingia litoralis]|uniref:MerC domain-containing protein n=1 Tax=Lujinxingia litoralis TaxID=2211119 RepID=UPI001314E3FB|nr:MerC domain-containing protein [Lujinxingia litoralis]